MRAVRLSLALPLIGLFVVVLAGTASSSPPDPFPGYHAPAIERECILDRGDRMDGVWRTTFNGHRVDLWCGDRLLVGDDGRCWIQIGSSASPAPCIGPETPPRGRR